MQRPGDMKTSVRRVLDEGMDATAIAVEPWRPYRYAIATKAGVNVYPTDPTRGPFMELHPKDPEKFIDGSLAILDVTEGRVFLTSPTPGKGCEGHDVFDPETKDDDPDDQFQLAVCNRAVAFTSPGECSSAYVSWGPEQDIDRVSITCSGPLALADKDTLLLSDNCEDTCKIACVPREGDKYLGCTARRRRRKRARRSSSIRDGRPGPVRLVGRERRIARRFCVV
jgi:hypothetical protein